MSLFSRQLILIIELYSHYDVYDYLRQIALTLCSDKVSQVRWISYKLVRTFIRSTTIMKSVASLPVPYYFMCSLANSVALNVVNKQQ